MTNSIYSNYLKTLSIYNDVSLKNIAKKYGLVYEYLVPLIFLCFLTFILISIFILNIYSNYFNKNYHYLFFITISIIPTMIFGTFLVKSFSKKLHKDYSSFSYLMKNHNEEWRGAKALYFFEKIEATNIKINKDKFLELIDEEFVLKKTNLLEHPFLLFLFSALGIIFSRFLEIIPNEVIYILFSFSIVLLYFSYNLLSIIRSRQSKVNDLKLFIIWYDEIYNKNS